MTGIEYSAMNAICDIAKIKKNDPDYWTRLEHQYAGMAMQGLLTNTALAKLLHDDNASIKDKTGIFSEWAKMYAHALVEKLKEMEERK